MHHASEAFGRCTGKPKEAPKMGRHEVAELGYMDIASIRCTRHDGIVIDVHGPPKPKSIFGLYPLTTRMTLYMTKHAPYNFHVVVIGEICPHSRRNEERLHLAQFLTIQMDLFPPVRPLHTNWYILSSGISRRSHHYKISASFVYSRGSLCFNPTFCQAIPAY